MNSSNRRFMVPWGGRLTLLVLGLVGVTSAAQAAMVFNYVGRIWNFSQPLAPAYQIYGTRALATLSIDDALVPVGFSGTLNNAQFTARLGTDSPSFPLQAAGDWAPPPQSGPPLSAFVTFSNGQIVDWSFGNVQNALGNTFTFASRGSGDIVYAFPRVVAFGTASSAGPGTWTLPTPVPLPAAGALLFAGLASLGAAARTRARGKAGLPG